MHAKYEISISYGSTVKAKVKIDNRQDKNNTPLIYQIINFYANELND